MPNIPSDPPSIDVRWVVPSQTTRIAVASFLPSGVAILPDSSGFTVTVPTASVTRTLAQDCAACLAANGVVAPKPAFTGTASVTTSLPSDISSATLTGGTLTITVTNNYTFDPLRPNGASAPFGKAVVTITNNGVQIGKDSLVGSTTTLAANGGTATLPIALSGAITGSAGVVVTMTLDSPAGSPVLIDVSKTIRLDATAQNLKVASANVTVSNKAISSTQTINLAGIDQTITNRVQSGALLFTVTNPFSVTGALTVRLTPDVGPPVVKTLQLAAGTSTPSIAFTQLELKSLLNHNVTVVYSGNVSTTTAGSTVNVTPKQAVVVASRLDISLEVGG